MFITSTTTAAATDVRYYNDVVQGRAFNGHANIQAHGYRFRAVACTQTVNALTNANLGGTGVPI